ncbi:MAG TPA: SigE family RNA polymerase sigma factor [Actinomycetes bacterium]|nr:SigE family RNA polymerase sigma factor [Actinomycetes bacterium]
MSFHDFYAKAWPRLVGQVYPLVGDLAAAEDAVQEAMVRAASHWSRVGRYDRPEAWVRRVAVRLAISGHRRARRQAAMLARLGPPADVPALDAEDRMLIDALAGLPAKYREALALHHLVDLSVEQVADQLGVPSGTVKARLVEGRRRLAALLEGEPAGPPRAAARRPRRRRAAPPGGRARAAGPSSDRMPSSWERPDG